MAATLAKLKSTRATRKGIITKAFNSIDNAANPDLSYLKEKLASISINMLKLDTAIENIFDSLEISDENEIKGEVSISEEIKDDFEKRIGLLKDRIYSMENHLKKNLNETSENKVLSPLPASYLPGPNLKLPVLKIPTFYDNSTNVFDFLNFVTAFENALAAIPNLSLATKLIYLKNSLQGKALSLVANLPINEENFTLAWNILMEEFMDSHFLVNTAVSELIAWPLCNNIISTAEFLSHIKVKRLELSRFQVSFSDPTSSGNVIISNIIRSKLPNFYFMELCRRTGSSYPDINDILTHSVEINRMFKASERVTTVPKSALPKVFNSTQEYKKKMLVSRVITILPALVLLSL